MKRLALAFTFVILSGPVVWAGDCSPHRLLKLLGETVSKEGGKPAAHSFPFPSPATRGRFYLTVENPEPRVSTGRIGLNGVTVVSSSDFAKDLDLLRFPIQVGPANLLEVSLGGKPGRSLTIRIEGVVALGDLSEDVGDHLFQDAVYGPRTFTRTSPPAPSTDPVPMPAIKGLFWLKFEQGIPAVTAGEVRFNQSRVILPDDFKMQLPEVTRPVIPRGNDQIRVLFQSNPQSNADISVFGWLVDNEPPVVTWESPLADAAHGPFAGTIARVTYSDKTSGVGKVEIFVNGQPATERFTVGPSEATADLAPAKRRPTWPPSQTSWSKVPISSKGA